MVRIGTGIALSHRVLNALMCPLTTHNKTLVSKEPEPASTVSGAVGPDACAASSKLLQNCMDNYSSEISKCQYYLDMLNECRRGSSSSSSSSSISNVAL
ncbi:uncharacterized protein A4U43_C07F35590 [Asparagus officinalis]|uniref:CHCH domain-containing protein n=1 Tax=Asparagus officinalis TaxID=4686 RepID=A0A5P1EH86_ASPOF|nr:uncharacterized protein A4U43_C07F35590 [Asparagus officinalis]